MIRYWSLFYRVRWSLAAEQGEWARHISRGSKGADWFIRNRATWGNARWMATRVWLPYYAANIALVG